MIPLFLPHMVLETTTKITIIPILCLENSLDNKLSFFYKKGWKIVIVIDLFYMIRPFLLEM